MSEVTSDPGPIDAMAAEYVLGTLDYDERKQAEDLLASDASFAAKVKMWERRLGELHLMVEPVEPDAQLWERIKAKVPQVAPAGEIKLPETDQEAPAGLTPAAESPADTEPKSDAAAMMTDSVPASEEPASMPAEAAASEPSSAPSWLAGPREPTDAAQPTAMPEPAAAGMPAVAPARTANAATAAVDRRVRVWRALAVLMMLVVAAAAALLAAWRWAPDHVPPALRPAALLRLIGVTVTTGAPARPPAPPVPPQSQFEE